FLSRGAAVSKSATQGALVPAKKTITAEPFARAEKALAEQKRLTGRSVAATGNIGIMAVLPNDAWVVRGGKNRPEDIERGTAIHPSGVAGVSVESAAGASVEQLATAIPHGQIGVTTVGKVRAAGGDVIPTSGRSPHHATLTGLTAEQASRLLTPT